MNRRLQIGGQPSVPFKVVVDDGLLDPGETEIVDRMAAFQRLAKMKSLVEIDHEANFAADRIANGIDGGNVIGEAFAAEAQLSP